MPLARSTSRWALPWRLPLSLALACLLLPTLGCRQGLSPQLAASARVWFEGPARWLMLPEEEREARGLADNREALDFIERFWRRRDPTPADPENPVRTAFFERAIAADRLYGEGNRRGSLTDRGRVLILFGSPPTLRYRQEAVPALAPDRERRMTEPVTRWITKESWVFGPQDLPPGFADLLPEDERGQEIVFEFATSGQHTYFLDGERYCEVARKAAVRAEE